MSTVALIRLRAVRAAASLFLRRPPAAFDSKRVRGVLVYGGMGIGNMVMFTPTLRAIREGMPRARIVLLTGGSGAGQVVAGGPLVDEVREVGSGALERLLLALKLRVRGFDLLVSSFQGDDFKIVTLLSGIPYRVGHVTSGGWQGRADFLYNIPARMEEDHHEVDRKLELSRAIGLSTKSESPAFHVTAGDRAAANALLESGGVTATDRLIALPIDVSRGQEWKRWNPQRLAAVCNDLHRRHGYRFILLGAPDRRDEVTAFVEMLEFQPLVALGRATLRETAAIIESCDLTICADSGLMHISAAMGTPALAIFGPTDFRRTSPTRYGPLHRVVRKPVECGPCFRMAGDAVVRACTHRKCLGMIESDEIVRAAEQMLGVAELSAAPAGR